MWRCGAPSWAPFLRFSCSSRPTLATVFAVLKRYCSATTPSRLSDPERRRYHIKVAKCGSDDPLALSDDQFTNDVGCYPSVDRADINDYLVHGTSFVTREQLKSYKSLEAHNYVTSGLVEPPRVKTLRDGNIVVLSEVRHSQAFKEKPLLPWLLIKPDGEVLCAHCTCMAGLDEASSALTTAPLSSHTVLI
ncbi:hypothetical protein HPB52_014724 [Rhipicephalus sanguineus]|uniref:Uncharacterized protein n=1 Tax=Rhipicephalus sanguineus TaxID=34632 RepID=A0A9D4SNP3_RHISA|nr:hypothetical protein HPB52_014724 [Rhipicephalus sanguineus]